MTFSLIETKDSTGHIKLYQHIIKDFDNLDANVNFISSEMYLNNFERTYFNKVNFEICGTKKVIKGKIFHRIQQFILMIKAFKKCSKNDVLILLSYDCIALWFALLFFNFKELYVFEHNNIDQLDDSHLKSFFYRKLSDKVVSYVFESYIGERVYKKYSRNYLVYKHPLFELKQINKFHHSNKYIFIPSSDVSMSNFLQLYNFAKKEGLDIITKKHSFLKDLPLNGVYQSEYFCNYEDIFLGAEYIGVVNDFKYRVSAVFYEAVANSKKVIMNNTLFSEKVKNNYEKIYFL